MDHAIYTAMGAASQTLNQQAVTASNLANASTPGFRAQLNALRAVPVDGLSLATRTLVTASTPGADMTPGQLDYTSRPLDVALQQDGWLVVQAADGLIQQIFKYRALTLKTIGADVCQVIGNHIHIGLLRVQTGFGDP